MSTEIRVPALGESIVEATVGRWLKGEGDQVAPGDAVVELETDKVNMEVTSEGGGVLESILKAEGTNVGIGDVLAVIGSAAGNGASSGAPDGGADTSSPAEIPTAATHTDVEENGSRATPLARRLASDHGLDLAAIAGSGPGGRVTKDDVTAAVNKRATPATPPAPAAVSSPAVRPTPTVSFPVRGVSGSRTEERVRMSRRRLTIARRLVEVQHAAAMLTTFNEVDMSAIMGIRKRRREAFKEQYGVGLGFMSFFTKAVVAALKMQPRLNAEIQGDEIVLKQYYDIGIAVSTEEGLVVPVVRDADTLTFAQIEANIADLAVRARTGTLTLPELQGGTFTITNGGIFGSLLSTPILNAPQVGILGMHKIQERPIAVGGEVVIRPMMYIAMSYDHRIVDGREAVTFLVKVKEVLEDPEVLLLES